MALYTKLANLIELGSEIGDKEIDHITKELEEAGNDSEQLKGKILLMLKKTKAEIKIERGKKINEEFHKVIFKLKELPYELLDSKPEVAAAYRKLNSAVTDDYSDVLDDDEKMIILEYLKNRKNSE